MSNTDPRVEAACRAGYAIAYQSGHRAAPDFASAHSSVQKLWRELMSAALAAADAATWCFDMERAPPDTELLLYCPERGIANHARMEFDYARTPRGSLRSWAIAWRLPPALPEVPDAR